MNNYFLRPFILLFKTLICGDYKRHIYDTQKKVEIIPEVYELFNIEALKLRLIVLNIIVLILKIAYMYCRANRVLEYIIVGYFTPISLKSVLASFHEYKVIAKKNSFIPYCL